LNAEHASDDTDVTEPVKAGKNAVVERIDGDSAGTNLALSDRYRLSRQLIELSNPGSARAESIGALRTHMLAQHIRDRRRALAICAPSIDVGATYVAANLAVALSRSGLKVLLIDANLRDPGLEQYFQPASVRPGLVQLLDDDPVPLGDVINESVLPNLSLIYAGGAVANAQELLASGNLKALIDICTRDYDLTLVDTAPSNTCADARRVAALVRYAMIVVRRNVSFVSDAKLLVEELQADRVTVIGTYLNDV
jgi:protein-tyrosine kinase